MNGKKDIIDEKLRNKLSEWANTKKEMRGLTSKSKKFEIIEFNDKYFFVRDSRETSESITSAGSKKGWIIVRSDIYPPYNILDYQTLLNGVKKELEESYVIRNGNDYSTNIEKSTIQRKNRSEISSVSLLTKYYRVIHKAFCEAYREELKNE